ncbi:MAG: cytochrome ubiquinol oxidase subunit I [Candidatus Caenarcaniphilales bacterium]|nr:cytochrome ubiquinol oxidase subunit I [Candidatus Caenarcaniphilales bacterium]
MDYPAWIIGGVGPGWVIGLVATFHVLISHFAVGGGIFLPFTEAWARKNNRDDVLGFLKKFTKFFLILTNVFGAISGVGIWWTIGLISPQATASLIRLFAFVWGAEWMVFLVEVLALVFYYYGWEKMKPQTHQTVGWIYAITAWLSLFTINGILTFMLTPGGWVTSGNLFEGYFNQGFWPALVVRTLVCIALAGIYATFVVSRMEPGSRLRKEMLAYTSTWLVPTYVLLGASLIWYFSVLPAPILETLLSGVAGGVGTAAQGNLMMVSRIALLCLVAVVTTGLAFFVSAYLNPREFTIRKSALMLASMAIFVVSFEYTREVIRKPYVVRNFMFSNGVPLKATVQKPLTRSFTEEMRFKPKDSSLGEQMFVGQCMACHTMEGYRSLTKRLNGMDAETIHTSILKEMQKPAKENRYHKIMPPVIGTEEELKALSVYLYDSIQEIQKRKGSNGAAHAAEVKH